MIERWPIWCVASIVDHFTTALAGIKVFAEGQVRDTNTVDSWVEVRVDGPYLVQEDPTNWRGLIETNILVSTQISKTNMYNQEELEGKVLAACVSINIYKLGNTGYDDKSYVACAQIASGYRERITVARFGQIDPKFNIRQSTVEVHYRVDLEVN